MADATKLFKRYEKKREERRSKFDATWQTLSNYYYPELSNINTEKTEGTTSWTDRVYDTTGIEAARDCASGQMAWALPAHEPWFAYSLPEALQAGSAADEAALWLANATQTALSALANSNFYTQAHMSVDSRTRFGTGLLYCAEGKNGGLNFKQFKIGTYVIDEDDEGRVDYVAREFEMSTRQILQSWPEADGYGGKIDEAIKAEKWDEKFKLLHIVCPREEIDRKKGAVDGKNKPVASFYMAVTDKHILDEDGYEEMPYFATRFDRWGTGTVWGYGPAFAALPDVRQLNYLAQFSDANYELLINPRTLIPENLSGHVDMRAGGITVFDPNAGANAMPQIWGEAGVQAAQALSEDIEKKQVKVKRMFFNDVFATLAQPELAGKRMTAYEVSQRMAEKMERLSPSFTQLVVDLCDPLLKRVFGLLLRGGHLGQPPEGAFVPTGDGKGRAIATPQIAYTSRLALMLKQAQNKAIIETLQMTGEFMQMTGRTDLLDNIDVDASMRAMAINAGFPAKLLRRQDDVIKIKRERADAMAKQQQMAMMREGAAAGKDLAKAPKEMQDAAMGGQ